LTLMLRLIPAGRAAAVIASICVVVSTIGSAPATSGITPTNASPATIAEAVLLMLPPFPRSSIGGPRGPQTRRRPVLVDPLLRQVDVGRDSVGPAPREVALRERVGVLVGDVGVAAVETGVAPPGGGHLVHLGRGQRDGLGGHLGGLVCQGRSRNERTQRCADQKLFHDVPLSGYCRRARSSELPPGSEHHALDAPIVSPAIKRTRMHRTYGVRAMLPKKYARERPGGGFDRVAFWVQGSLWRLQLS